MSNDKLKSNTFENEIDSFLKSLELDPLQVKQILPTGILYYFKFNEHPVYVSIPAILPCDYSNISRIEVEVVRLDVIDAGCLIYNLGLYLDTHDCSPIRIIPRSHGPKVKIIIQFVCNLLLLQPTALVEILLHCCDVGNFIREKLIEKKYDSVA